MVETRSIKKFARKLPAGSVLREILLAEPDEMSPEEFIAKVDVWLRLARLEGDGHV